MAASSAPIVKANLLTILQARAGLSGVGITWANPGQAIKQEAIWFGKVSEDEYMPALGNQAREETYTLEVIIFCVRDGGDPQAVETRWWEILAELEAALKADPKVGGAVNYWVKIQGFEQRPFTDNGQRGSEGEVRLECKHKK